MKKIETILKKQSSLKVVLNGGKYELEDSTIPFQIGFDESIANRKPTHILVVDVTENCFYQSGERKNYSQIAERNLFKLEPVQYLQLKRPGIHHLVFILFSGVDSGYYRYLMMKNHSYYENDLWFDSIEDYDLKHQIGYAEVIVTVPKIFFADEPETKFQKAIYSWVNSWYRLKPVDECEYRKRKIIGFTIKPLLWFLGFIPRLIIAILLSICVFAIKVIAFVVGWQPVLFLPKKKEMWINFLFLYPVVEYGEVFEGDFWFGKTERGKEDTDCYGFKVIAIGKKRFYMPLTLLGLLFYSFCIFGFITLDYKLIIGDTKGQLGSILALMLVISTVVTLLMVFITLPTLKKEEEWERKWSIEIPEGKKLVYKTIKLIFFPLGTVTLLSFAIPLISWNKKWKSFKICWILHVV